MTVELSSWPSVKLLNGNGKQKKNCSLTHLCYISIRCFYMQLWQVTIPGPSIYLTCVNSRHSDNETNNKLICHIKKLKLHSRLHSSAGWLMKFFKRQNSLTFQFSLRQHNKKACQDLFQNESCKTFKVSLSCAHLGIVRRWHDDKLKLGSKHKYASYSLFNFSHKIAGELSISEWLSVTLCAVYLCVTHSFALFITVVITSWALRYSRRQTKISNYGCIHMSSNFFKHYWASLATVPSMDCLITALFWQRPSLSRAFSGD